MDILDDKVKKIVVLDSDSSLFGEANTDFTGNLSPDTRCFIVFVDQVETGESPFFSSEAAPPTFASPDEIKIPVLFDNKD